MKADQQLNRSPVADELMTVQELAAYLHVPPSWIYDNHARLGIPSVRVGRMLRFRLTAVDRWLDDQAD